MNAMTHTDSASSVHASRAMIVSLSISQWSGRRLDREVTDEVNQQHNAASDAGRYNKLLLPREALAGIVAIVSERRIENGLHGLIRSPITIEAVSEISR